MVKTIRRSYIFSNLSKERLHGEVFMIDTGMSRGQDALAGALLKIRGGEADVEFPRGPDARPRHGNK